ncbi:hypothetical protein AC1031_009661 [Aphanomyces cochlioides]|nr:hypothetical protein AC1031_009661 [Aphanomyces cochlioides]
MSNASSRRAMKPWRICEHDYAVGIRFGELCFWMDEIDAELDSTPPRYHVWAATYSLETPQLCWFKFFFRSLLRSYMLFVLWSRYYRHYGILMRNLRSLGLGHDLIAYQVILGDPGYVVLSDPLVSLAMFIDIWCGPPYMVITILRVSQFHDFWAYGLGCMYLSRTVWFAYLCMRGLSSFVKLRRWEASFALTNYKQYLSGPVTSLLTMTPLAWLFRQFWDVCLPQSQKGQAVESIIETLNLSLALTN